LTLHPKHKKKVSSKANGKAKANGEDDLVEKDKQKRLFPGLALADQDWQPSISKDVLMKEVDDMMAQFESSAKTRTKPDRDAHHPPNVGGHLRHPLDGVVPVHHEGVDMTEDETDAAELNWMRGPSCTRSTMDECRGSKNSAHLFN
jgi:hypothetical protein